MAGDSSTEKECVLKGELMTLLDEQLTTINEDIDRKLQATTATLQRSINDNIAALTTRLERMVNQPPNNGRDLDGAMI